MVYILIPAHSSRLSYALELVFGYVLRVPYQTILANEFEDTGAVKGIDYAGMGLEGWLSIPNSGFLALTELVEYDFQLLPGELPLPFYQPEQSAESLDFDLFASVFYLVTEYEKQLSPRYDAHGRYDEQAYLSFHQGWHRRPLVNLYSEMLWEKLRDMFPALERPAPKAEYHLTFDIDHPWKYLHKGLAISLAGLGKKIITGKWADAKEQFKVLIKSKDPFFTFERIYSHCPPQKTTFFFLGDRNSPHDNRFRFSQKVYQKLIRDVEKKGYQIGIHPSYTSFLDRNRIKTECTALSQVTDKGITSSRQHFLKYRLPETFRYLAEAGIEQDFSLCMYSEPGFRTHIANPYPWFDLEANEQSPLMLHPTLAMDRSLQQYMGLSPEEAHTHLQGLWREVQAVGGTFTLLLHNDALSDSGEWQGWSQHLLAFVDELQGK